MEEGEKGEEDGEEVQACRHVSYAWKGEGRRDIGMSTCNVLCS